MLSKISIEVSKIKLTYSILISVLRIAFDQSRLICSFVAIISTNRIIGALSLIAILVATFGLEVTFLALPTTSIYEMDPFHIS